MRQSYIEQAEPLSRKHGPYYHHFVSCRSNPLFLFSTLMLTALVFGFIHQFSLILPVSPPQRNLSSLSLCLSVSMYPEITSDSQRHEYKREFDADLKLYKNLCAEMDDINDQLNKLSRELDTLDEGTSKYQVRHTTGVAIVPRVLICVMCDVHKEKSCARLKLIYPLGKIYTAGNHKP